MKKPLMNGLLRVSSFEPQKRKGQKSPFPNLQIIWKEKFTMKKFFDFILFLFTGKGDFANNAIENGAVSYEGQGRDKYGK